MKRNSLRLAAIQLILAAFVFSGCQITEPTQVDRGYGYTPPTTSGTTVTPSSPEASATSAAQPLTVNPQTTEAAFETSQLRVTKILVSAAPVGGEAKFEIRLEALENINGVAVTETLPNGLSFVSAEPVGSISGKSIRWTFPSMNAGQVETISIIVKPVAEGDQNACTVVTVDNSLCLPFFAGEARLSVVKTGPKTVELGQEGTWTVNVTNNGSAPATNVVVTDKLPDAFQATSPLRHELGTIQPGETKSSQFTAKVIAQGEFRNQASVTHDGDPTGSAPGSTVSSVDPTFVVQSAIKVTQTGPTKAYVFKPERFSTNIENTGDTDLKNVRITQLLPEGMSVTDNGNGRVSGNAIGWMIPNLPAGSSQTIATEMTSTRKGPTTVTTKAITPLGIEASDSVGSEWLAVPGVTISITDTKDPIRVNEQTVYQIQVRNQGDFEPVSGTVEVSFTETIKPTSVAGNAQGTISGSKVTFPRTTLEPGKDTDLTITATGAEIGPGRVVLRFSADFLESPIISEETTNVY